MSGIRLHLVVEGQSEETFARRLLADHLAQFEVWVDARSVYTSRSGPYWCRGGMTSFERAKRDVLFWMRQDQNEDARFSTMFDLYRLPDDFPGMDLPVEEDHHRYVSRLETAFREAIERELNDGRFHPYFQLHEFEALLIGSPRALKRAYPGTCTESVVEEIEGILSSVTSPEEIDLDEPPSKRIEALIPDYEKVAAISLLANSLDLDEIRSGCPHFHAWLKSMENLS